MLRGTPPSSRDTRSIRVARGRRSAAPLDSCGIRLVPVDPRLVELLEDGADVRDLSSIEPLVRAGGEAAGRATHAAFRSLAAEFGGAAGRSRPRRRDRVSDRVQSPARSGADSSTMSTSSAHDSVLPGWADSRGESMQSSIDLIRLPNGDPRDRPSAELSDGRSTISCRPADCRRPVRRRPRLSSGRSYETFFGIEPNARAEPDFVGAGIELKSVPIHLAASRREPRSGSHSG